MNDGQKRLPGPDWLREQLARGLSQKQIVDSWEVESGYRVARSTIAILVADLAEG